MTIKPKFPLQARTDLFGLDFPTMRQFMLHEAEEHDLPVIENSDDQVIVETPYGQYDLRAAKDGVHVLVSATKEDWLFVLKESLVQHLAEISEQLAAAVRWSDQKTAGQLPANFRFAIVQSVIPVGDMYLRVRIKAEDLSSYQDDAIHFRLVLPPKGLDPVEWPSVAENGATVWPKGDKALHRPVYTTRWIDQDAGLMDFDVFLHEGGRVTDWASAVQPGAEVALIGPGGGGIPETRRILMYADETGMPALARILESLPDDTEGEAVLLCAEEMRCSYPLVAPTGVSVTWLARSPEVSLATRAIEAMADKPDHFIWFASEKRDTQRVRAACKATERDPATSYVAAYWSQS